MAEPEASKDRIPPGVLLLTVGTGFVTLTRAMTLSFLALKLQQTFGLTPMMIGFLLGFGSLTGAIAGPFGGALSDRTGRRVMLSLVLGKLSISTLVLGLAESVLLFSVAQCVAATAMSLYGPISRALMSDLCTERTRLKYFSWRYTASNAGWVVGPLIGVGAGLASTPLFLVGACVYGAMALLLYCSYRPAAVDPDEPKALRPGVIASIREAFGNSALVYFTLGSTLFLAVYGQWSATLAPYLVENMKDGATIYAYLLSINGLVVLTASAFTRPMIERVGPLRALLLGSGLLVISQLCFSVSNGLAGLAASMVVFTLGEILVVPAEYMLVDSISCAKNRGRSFGAHSLSAVGGFIGPTFGGAALELLGGSAMFLLFAAFIILGTLFFFAGVGKQR
ncbi:putative MFS family arabinose efflux permease [Rhizobium sp. PP-F2F-G38]|nr:putative MFS family arabinose efflux permease [Rhizobium sp. PP-F2F-G20b]PYE93280.1 putative MFS family arabinose efflux permease [Rhizobium sp. PP-F2F-G38]TCL89390.1 putative MFS family arabinose efflux permease [Rhizobium sp. PP-WC-2G-219]